MEDKMKKVLVGTGIGVVAAGLAFAGTSVYKDKKSDAEKAKLTTEIATLSNAIESAKADSVAKEAMISALDKKFTALGVEVTNFKTQLSDKDKQILDLTAQVNLEIQKNSEVSVTTPVDTETATSTDVSGYVIDEIALTGNFTKTLRDDKVSVLLDSSIDFLDEDYNVEERIVIADTLIPMYSGANGEDFGTDIYVGASSKEAVKYQYLFKEAFNFSNIDETESDTKGPLNIKLLGKDISIVKVDDGASEITYKQAQSVTGFVGDVIYGVTIVNVGDTAAVVSYKGVTEVVNKGVSKTVNGIKVKLVSTFTADTMAEKMAEFEIGDVITKTVKTGDAMTLFGEVNDDQDALWVWDIAVTDNVAGGVIGAKLNQRFKNLDDEFAPLKAGQQIVFPNDYAALTFLGTNKVDYNKLTVGFDNIDDLGDVISLSSSNANLVGVIGSIDTNYDTIYINSTGSIFVDGEDGYDELTSVTIEQDEGSNLAVGYVSGTGVLTIGDVKVTVNSTLLTENILKVETDADISAKDYDVVTSYGTIIYDVKQSVEDDELVIGIPSEQVTVELKVN